MKLFWNLDKNKDSFWERYHYENSFAWISELLINLKVEVIENIKDLKEDEGLIIVDFKLNNKQSFYFELSNKFSKIYLIHLGDEGASEDTNLIYSLCSHVWRTFAIPKFYEMKNLTCIPIGYKSVVYKKNIISPKKKYLWSFMGTVHGASRFDMINKHNEIKPNFIKLTSEFAAKDSLGPEEYYTELNDSIFTLVPNGYYHPETYRLYEALECGSIPIIENPFNFFDHFLKNNPIPKINNWKESAVIIKKLIDDEKSLIKLSKDIDLWWSEYKKKIQKNFVSETNV
tara:strand:- start:1228 stop:2085 length:858 start_codon:yes stop_codon:yes gene_type:complete